MMKVEELIEMLEECDPNAEVRFASQPSWPFENTIEDVVSYEDKQDKDVVYLQEGSQIGYLPDGPKEAMGW